MLSEVLDQHLLLESLTRSRRQILPGILRRRIHHLAELTPEVCRSVGLTTWGRHSHLGTAERLRHTSLLLSFDFSFELCTGFVLSAGLRFSRGLSRIRTLRTEELVDVISENVWIRQHDVHGCTLFTSCFEKQGLGLTTLNLLNQSIFNSTSVGVQQLRGFSTKVLKNFQRLVRDLAQISITYGSALLQACGLLLGQGLELLHLAGGVSRG